MINDAVYEFQIGNHETSLRNAYFAMINWDSDLGVRSEKIDFRMIR